MALFAACGDPAARVQLVPVPLPNDCGRPAAKTALRVIAYTGAGELRRTVPPTEIDAFPADTEQLGVEVIGGDNGALVAIGKTPPLDFDGLLDGATIPIVMAPPDGFCAVGALTEPRSGPVVARAGAGALIAGGRGPGGEPLATAEYYDATTASFVPVAVPPSLLDPDNGLAGAVLTELPDGTVALTGTASHAYAVFDPATRTLSTPSLFDHRAYHGAVALDGEHLLVIGGCADVVAGACSGPSLRTGFTYDLRDLASRERGPALDDGAVRLGAHVFDLGVQRDGVRRFLLAGGFGQLGAADRFAATDLQTEPVTGLHAQVVALDGGAVLTAFDPDGMPPSGAAGVLAPDGTGVIAIALAPRIDGARLATLEDGSVLALGGGIVSRYLPTTNTWSTVMPAGAAPSLDAPTTVRLDDGTLLVLGGRVASTEAFVYRPSLVGPATGSIVALPDGSTEGVLTPSDPSTVSRTGGRFVLAASGDDLRARALVGGPRMAQGSITAIVRVIAGGVALIAQQTGPGRAVIGRLVPGEPARITELGGVAACTGSVVDAGELEGPLGLAVSEGIATLSVGPAGATTVKVTCAIDGARRGAWGVAAAGNGAQIEVGPVTVARSH